METVMQHVLTTQAFKQQKYKGMPKDDSVRSTQQGAERALPVRSW